MSGTWQTVNLAQNGNTTQTWTLFGRRFRLITVGVVGGNSAVGFRRHNALPDGNHHVNIEVIGSDAAQFVIAGYEV